MPCTAKKRKKPNSLNIWQPFRTPMPSSISSSHTARQPSQPTLNNPNKPDLSFTKKQITDNTSKTPNWISAPKSTRRCSKSHKQPETSEYVEYWTRNGTILWITVREMSLSDSPTTQRSNAGKHCLVLIQLTSSTCFRTSSAKKRLLLLI